MKKWYTIIVCSIFSFIIFYKTSHLNAAKKELPQDFGTKHFIVGYDKKYPQQKRNKTSIVAQNSCTVLFSPIDNIRPKLREIIKNEKQSIHIAMFSFTDQFIAKELIAAKKRGIEVQLVTDSACLRNGHNKLRLLAANGIEVFVYKAMAKNKTQARVMHHKFALFKNNKNKQSLLWSGSLNFTKSACEYNEENVLILTDSRIFNKYDETFRRVKKEAIALGKIPKQLFI